MEMLGQWQEINDLGKQLFTGNRKLDPVYKQKMAVVAARGCWAIGNKFFKIRIFQKQWIFGLFIKHLYLSRNHMNKMKKSGIKFNKTNLGYGKILF